MSVKNRDKYNRWRDITIAFRVTKQENMLINKMVKLSGGTKQAYLTNNMLKHEIVIVPNPRVHKALKEEMKEMCELLAGVDSADEISDETVAVLKMIAEIYKGLEE